MQISSTWLLTVIFSAFNLECVLSFNWNVTSKDLRASPRYISKFPLQHDTKVKENEDRPGYLVSRRKKVDYENQNQFKYDLESQSSLLRKTHRSPAVEDLTIDIKRKTRGVLPTDARGFIGGNYDNLNNYNDGASTGRYHKFNKYGGGKKGYQGYGDQSQGTSKYANEEDYKKGHSVGYSKGFEKQYNHEYSHDFGQDRRHAHGYNNRDLGQYGYGARGHGGYGHGLYGDTHQRYNQGLYGQNYGNILNAYSLHPLLGGYGHGYGYGGINSLGFGAHGLSSGLGLGGSLLGYGHGGLSQIQGLGSIRGLGHGHGVLSGGQGIGPLAYGHGRLGLGHGIGGLRLGYGYGGIHRGGLGNIYRGGLGNVHRGGIGNIYGQVGYNSPGHRNALLGGAVFRPEYLGIRGHPLNGHQIPYGR